MTCFVWLRAWPYAGPHRHLHATKSSALESAWGSARAGDVRSTHTVLLFDEEVRPELLGAGHVGVVVEVGLAHGAQHLLVDEEVSLQQRANMSVRVCVCVTNDHCGHAGGANKRTVHSVAGEVRI